MKKILIAVVVVIVLLLGAAVLAPMLIPVETYKEQIATQVREATGREFVMAGDISLSILPDAALEVNDVTFGNAEGGRADSMATLKQLQVDVQLLPLLSGELAIDRFILVEPQINLEVLPDGSGNWQLAGMGGGDASAGGSGGGTMPLGEIRLGDVRIDKGTISYFDAKTGEEQVLSDVNMSIDLPSLSSPLNAEGSMVWQGEKIEISMDAAELRSLMEGGATDVGLSVASAPVSLDYRGTVTGGAAAKAAGDVTLDVPSVRNLMAWVGNPMPEGEGFGPLSITGRLDAADGRMSFSNATVAFDDIKGAGEVTIETGGGVPAVTARLDLEQMALDPYLPAPTEDEGSATAAAPAEWSDEPIDASALRLFNADLALSSAGISARDVKIGRSALTMKVAGGKLTADLTELELYQGRGVGQIVVDASGDVPALRKSFRLEGIQAEPFLSDVTGNDRLSGTGNLRIEVAGRGGSQKQIVESLNGQGGFEFRDGAIKGINLAAMVRNVSSAFLDSSAGEAQKTDFSELAATFTITNGILRNEDLTMSSPLIRVTGAGTADLPNRTVNYKVNPKLVASTTGQGGAEDLKGIAVPVIITGPWHDLSYAPDLAGAVDIENLTRGATDAAKGLIEGAAGSGTGAAGDAVKGILGGGTEGGTSSGSAGDAVKGLLGGSSGSTESGTTGGTAPTGESEPLKQLKGLFGN